MKLQILYMNWRFHISIEDFICDLISYMEISYVKLPFHIFKFKFHIWKLPFHIWKFPFHIWKCPFHIWNRAFHIWNLMWNFRNGQKSRKCPFPRPYINICQGENASGSPYSCVITKMSYYFWLTNKNYWILPWSNHLVILFASF